MEELVSPSMDNSSKTSLSFMIWRMCVVELECRARPWEVERKGGMRMEEGGGYRWGQWASKKAGSLETEVEGPRLMESELETGFELCPKK